MDTEIKNAFSCLASKVEDRSFESVRNRLIPAIAEADAAGFDDTRKALIAILKVLEQEYAVTMA